MVWKNKYKAGHKYCHLCTEEKVVIASYNSPNKLLNQKSEIFNVCRHKKGWLFGRYGILFYLFIFLLC